MVQFGSDPGPVILTGGMPTRSPPPPLKMIERAMIEPIALPEPPLKVTSTFGVYIRPLYVLTVAPPLMVNVVVGFGFGIQMIIPAYVPVDAAASATCA